MGAIGRQLLRRDITGRKVLPKGRPKIYTSRVRYEELDQISRWRFSPN